MNEKNIWDFIVTKIWISKNLFILLKKIIGRKSLLTTENTQTRDLIMVVVNQSAEKFVKLYGGWVEKTDDKLCVDK
jgi:hypothetical protein